MTTEITQVIDPRTPDIIWNVIEDDWGNAPKIALRPDAEIGIPTVWPSNVHKTTTMLEMELSPHPDDPSKIIRTDIRTILLRALAQFERDRDAAQFLAITPPTLSIWIFRLNIVDIADEVRLRTRPANHPWTATRQDALAARDKIKAEEAVA